MPKMPDLEEIDLKFDECRDCAFVTKLRTCRNCDAGEFFEEREPEGIDDIIRG